MSCLSEVRKTAVHQANWSAGYDIRVDTRTNDKPVTLVYKASITQNTGEVCLIGFEFEFHAHVALGME